MHKHTHTQYISHTRLIVEEKYLSFWGGMPKPDILHLKRKSCSFHLYYFFNSHICTYIQEGNMALGICPGCN